MYGCYYDARYQEEVPLKYAFRSTPSPHPSIYQIQEIFFDVTQLRARILGPKNPYKPKWRKVNPDTITKKELFYNLAKLCAELDAGRIIELPI